MNLILNDNIECYLTINKKNTNIDGQREPIYTNKKFYCSYSSVNGISYTADNVETIAKGSIRINGDITDNKTETYDGTVKLFGVVHNIISINRCRSLFNSNKVDFTEIFFE